MSSSSSTPVLDLTDEAAQSPPLPLPSTSRVYAPLQRMRPPLSRSHSDPWRDQSDLPHKRVKVDQSHDIYDDYDDVVIVSSIHEATSSKAKANSSIELLHDSPTQQAGSSSQRRRSKSSSPSSTGGADSSSSAPPASSLLSSTTCPICFSPPKNATLTPCGHLLCGECLFLAVGTGIQRMVAQRPPPGLGGPNGEVALALAMAEAKCPVCRAPIEGWDGKGGGVIGLKFNSLIAV